MKPTPNDPTARMSRPARPAIGLGLGLVLAAAGPSIGQDRPPGASIRNDDGTIQTGRLRGDAQSGFVFQVEPNGPAIGLDRTGLIQFKADAPGDSAGSPPFRLILGHDQAISGRGPVVDGSTVRLEVGPSGRPVVADRAGVLAIRQRPGEAAVLLEPFEAWSDAVWEREGELTLDESDPREGSHSLRIPATPSRVTHRLPSTIASGRIDLAFRQPKRLVPDHRWFVELEFRGDDGPPQPVRIVPGWSDESPGVETPQGPSLAIQRLTLNEQWHVLSVRFDDDSLEITIDRAVLAHGKGPAGELFAVRIASESTGNAGATAGLSAHVDNLRIVQFLDDSRSQEGDRTHDELRLTTGDQLFGAIRSADDRGATIDVLGQQVTYPWSDMIALGFRRAALVPRAIDGRQARIIWSSGDEPHPDAAEGVLLAVNDQTLELETPYAGKLTIPTDRVRSILPLGRGRRILIDPTPHHLGDQFMPRFVPPQPEGGTLERAFTLETIPDTPVFLVLDVIEAAGADDNLDFAPMLKLGELRTNLSVNGQEIDYLNKYIHDRNELPQRVRVLVPNALLKAGDNRLRFDQVGKKTDPGFLDDLGILTIAIEIPAPGGEAP